jgi:hypothetical protein
MAPLFDLERTGPAILHRVAKAVQRTDSRVSAPRESQLPCTSGSDQLVVDEIRRHADEGQVPPALADDFVASRKGNEVGKPLQGNAVAVLYMRSNRFG